MLLSLVVLVVVSIPTAATAHPGNTDGDGCHTCRTNCTEKWGIPYGYYHRHNPVRDCFESAPPPTDPPPPTTTTSRPTTTTTAPQTTTTRAPPVEPTEGDLGTQLQKIKEHIRTLSDELVLANRLWEARDASYGGTHDAFSQVAADVSSQMVVIQDEANQSPSGDSLVALVAVLQELQVAAVAVIEGLEAPDDGRGRVAAMGHWLLAVDALDDVHETRPNTTTTRMSTAEASDASLPAETSTSVALATPDETEGSGDRATGWVLVALAAVAFAYRLGRRHSSRH